MNRLLLILTIAVGMLGCDRCSEQHPSEEVRVLAPPSLPISAPTSQVVAGAQSAPRLAPVPSTPLSDEDLAVCRTKGDLLGQSICLGSLAQRHRDTRYCDEVEKLAEKAGEEDPSILRDGVAARQCFRTIAYMRDDPGICVRVTDPAMAGSCLSYFAMKRRDASLCALGQASEAGMTCYLNEATRLRDPELCTKTGKYEVECTKRLGPLSP